VRSVGAGLMTGWQKVAALAIGCATLGGVIALGASAETAAVSVGAFVTGVLLPNGR
jgi:hypothetical protein